MAKNEALFEESSRGAVSAVTGLVVVLSFILAFGGFYLMSVPFDAGIDETAALWTFTGGLIATCLGFFLPFTLLSSTGK